MPSPIFATGGLRITERATANGVRFVVDDGRQQQLGDTAPSPPELDVREALELYESLGERLRLVPGGLDG